MMDSDFPLQEEVEDYSGRKREFEITCEELPLGYTVRAVESGKEGNGYQFAAYSETSPYSALGRLRQKMYKALATRHITRSDGHYRMLHDTVSGQITWEESVGVCVVVDGQLLSMEDLAALFASHEGWEFELIIRDSMD